MYQSSMIGIAENRQGNRIIPEGMWCQKPKTTGILRWAKRPLVSQARYYLGRILSLFLAGIAFIVIARILGPSTYGIYTLVIAYVGFFGAFTDLGVGTLIQQIHRPVYNQKREKTNRGAALERLHHNADNRHHTKCRCLSAERHDSADTSLAVSLMPMS